MLEKKTYYALIHVIKGGKIWPLFIKISSADEAYVTYKIIYKKCIELSKSINVPNLPKLTGKAGLVFIKAIDEISIVDQYAKKLEHFINKK
jgi:hypothetical protein